MLSKNIEQAKADVRERAIERWDDEWTLFTTEWCDDDWQVKAVHGGTQSDAGNTVQQVIIASPFGMRYEVREVTGSESWKELHMEEL